MKIFANIIIVTVIWDCDLPIRAMKKIHTCDLFMFCIIGFPATYLQVQSKFMMKLLCSSTSWYTRNLQKILDILSSNRGIGALCLRKELPQGYEGLFPAV